MFYIILSCFSNTKYYFRANVLDCLLLELKCPHDHCKFNLFFTYFYYY
jgi:hypothetical protein